MFSKNNKWLLMIVFLLCFELTALYGLYSYQGDIFYLGLDGNIKRLDEENLTDDFDRALEEIKKWERDALPIFYY